MVKMSSSFSLPPVIRRFGKCGEWEQRVSSSSTEVGESSTGEFDRNKPRSLSFYGGATGTERVKSFVTGIVSPFTACLQPSVGSCVPACAPNHAFGKQPSVVSPHLDRVNIYRDSIVEHEQDDYSRHPRRHQIPNNYHRSKHLSKSSPTATPSATFPSRRELATEDDVASNYTVPGKTTTVYDKRKKSTDITKPRSNDILCGRGGSSNRHLGNIQFRELVAANKQIYIGLTKKQKMLVARKIVRAIHNTGGRFLAKDLDTGLFYDIGLPRSLEKTSQALREKHSNEMPVQPVEDEGIETSVESHDSLIKNNTNTDGGKSIAEESPAKASPSSKSGTKISKNTETPSLIIPYHLINIFGKKGSSAYEEDLENNHQHALSPRTNYRSNQLYENHHSPYPISPYRIPVGSSPSQHNQKSYPTVAGHSPVQSGHYRHRRPRSPTSPISSSNQYQHQNHYYPGHPPQTPPYGQRIHGPDEWYAYPTYDDRDVYSSEYYPRSTDYEQATSRRSPQGMPPPAQYHRFPAHLRSSGHRGHPIAHGSPHTSFRGAPPPPRSSLGSQVPPPQPPPYPPSQHNPHGYYRYESDGSLPSLPLPHDTSPSSRIIYRTTNSGYVRCNSDVSPARQRELKRPRNGAGQRQTTRTSEVSLSSAVKNSLSLDDRVVGREREKLKQQQPQESNPAGRSSSSFCHRTLVSPSTMLQSKSFLRSSVVVESGRGSPSEKKEDYSALSGLAALSTAAFLKLDEDRN